MSEPITTEQLDALVLAVDTAAEERGWTKRHLLVRVEAGTSDDDVQLGFKEIDGHPLNALLGFTAPAEWLALGEEGCVRLRGRRLPQTRCRRA